MKLLRGLAAGDLALIAGDRTAQFLVFYPLILGLVVRFGLEPLNLRLPIDLEPYYLLIVSLLIAVMAPVVIGTVAGLMVLDEKDTRTLLALRVTPLSLKAYLAWRAGVPVTLYCGSALLLAYMLGPHVAPRGAGWIVLAALAAAPFMVASALLISGLAENKVQGLALSKGLGPFIVAAMVAWWVPEPWQWLLGVFPSYWPVKLYWHMAEGVSVLVPLVGTVVCGTVWIWALAHLFLRRLARHLA